MEKTKILRKSRVIPFGYSVDETGKFLISIPFELESLEEAKNYLKTCSYREVAKWLHRKTNRYISYVGLKKRIIRDRATKAKEESQTQSQAIS
jgi:hypothetical protein|tara:strand:+ start:527 stop:805 length:279 start_codon:yes stop_codon:yes gene_type:complete